MTKHAQIPIILERHIYVDAEIAEEIKELNTQGIATVGSCQGPPPTAMITPKSASFARAIGHNPQYDENLGLFQIALQGGL